ncbi:hypothetical protein J6590_080007, partial [Homalodisca vitripennis]
FESLDLFDRKSLITLSISSFVTEARAIEVARLGIEGGLVGSDANDVLGQFQTRQQISHYMTRCENFEDLRYE